MENTILQSKLLAFSSVCLAGLGITLLLATIRLTEFFNTLLTNRLTAVESRLAAIEQRFGQHITIDDWGAAARAASREADQGTPERQGTNGS